MFEGLERSADGWLLIPARVCARLATDDLYRWHIWSSRPSPNLDYAYKTDGTFSAKKSLSPLN